MTTLFRVTPLKRDVPTDVFVHDMLHTTKRAAEKQMTDLRNDGISSDLHEVVLKATGIGILSKKDLYCALYNHQGYLQVQAHLKHLAGIKARRS